MAFKQKIQGAKSDEIAEVMRGFDDTDWAEADAWLAEVMTTYDADPYAYAKVFELSGVDTSGASDNCWAGHGLADRIRTRDTRD